MGLIGPIVVRENIMAKKKASVVNDSTSTSRMGDFGSAITQICEEKGISKEKVIETIEAALAAAYKKDYGKNSYR